MDDMQNVQVYLQSLQALLVDIQDRLEHVERRCDVSKGGLLDTWFEERFAQMNARAYDKSDTVVYSYEHVKQNSGNPSPHETQMELDEVQCEAPTSSHFRGITDLEYKFGESVWDASILLWLPEIGFSSSCFLAGMLALNLFIQGFMSYALLTTEEFVNSEKISGVFHDVEKWRLIDGHDVKNMDLREESLVSRVCNKDESLSVASGQLQLIGEINSYLSLGVDDFDVAAGFSKGPLLCMLCILLFALVAMTEFRQSVYFLLCISTLPHRRTQLKEGIIEALSWPRLICMVILTCARLSVCAAILISGLCWLSTTTNIGNLILNAAALGFILNIDEILFSSIVPTKVAQTLGKVEPLCFRAKLFLMDAILPVLCTIFVLLVAHQQYIGPDSARLLDIKRALCAGGQNFVATYNAETGMSISRQTQPFMDELMPEAHPVMMAVSEIMSRPPKKELWELECAATIDPMVPLKSYWADQIDFEHNSKYSVAEWSKAWNPECEDLQYDPEGTDCELIYFLETQRQKFFEDEAPSAQFQCSDYQQLCDLIGVSFVLKALCPVTCGCDNPLSGLFFGALEGTVDGCPSTCKGAREDKLKSVPCFDVSTESEDATIAGWQRYWGTIASMDYGLNQSAVPVGCEAAFELLGTKFEEFDLCTDTPMMKYEGISSMVPFCPASCCRSSGTCIPRCAERMIGSP